MLESSDALPLELCCWCSQLLFQDMEHCPENSGHSNMLWVGFPFVLGASASFQYVYYSLSVCNITCCFCTRHCPKGFHYNPWGFVSPTLQMRGQDNTTSWRRARIWAIIALPPGDAYTQPSLCGHQASISKQIGKGIWLFKSISPSGV